MSKFGEFLIWEKSIALSNSKAVAISQGKPSNFVELSIPRDFPNDWDPIQHMIAEGLARSGSKEAKLVGEDIAVRWIRTNYKAYKKTGVMHEKYDVEEYGEF
ncbi:putative alpha,alpha-trehalase [Rosa chinensis]|uniref:alpha,alpha-trehalase n=1 Tax=Rosa chinensis TaxID=74649 RepID=A0A2P6PNC6_ROSCH|nr:putative alpha,alpha-trehalase [Rosa chinensis]